MNTISLVMDHAIEALESRVAPAAVFVSPTMATYTDVDGDRVTVTFSKGILTEQNVGDILVTAAAGLGDQLQEIDLLPPGLLSVPEGLNITVTAKAHNAMGDGFVNVGAITANGRHLGTVKIHGDLGQINVGDGGDLVLRSLSVQSLFAFGTTTGATTYVSTINGGLGSLKVVGDITGALLDVIAGNLGAVTIGGSLVGAGDLSSGGISVEGDLGSVLVKGSVVGSTGDASGSISAASIGKVTILGSLLGGTANNSGGIHSGGDLGAVKIGRDVRGGQESSLQDAIATGAITSNGKITSVTIGGSLFGGSGNSSGIVSSEGGIGPVKIAGSVIGDGSQSARIRSEGSIESVKVGGDMRGGFEEDSCAIAAGSSLGPVTIGGSVIGVGSDSAHITSENAMGLVTIAGDLRSNGGVFTNNALIESGDTIVGVTVGGSIVGGGFRTGYVHSAGAMGAVRTGSDLIGGFGDHSGAVASDDTLGPVTVGGSLVGGHDPNPSDLDFFGAQSGRISSQGAMGFVRIGGDVVGGSAPFAGSIESRTSLVGVFIGGSLIGGQDFTPNDNASGGLLTGTISAKELGPIKILGSVIGGSGDSSGIIDVSGSPGFARSISIGGSLIGGSKPDTGSIRVEPFTNSPHPIGPVTIGGSVIGGSASGTGRIFSDGPLGPVKIGGDLVGGDVPTAATISDTGAIQGRSIKSVTIAGSIIAGTESGGGTLIRSGAINADFDIGSITVGGGLIGNAQAPVIITAVGEEAPGATADVALRSLTVGGSVQFANLAFGYDKDFSGQNGDAQVGTVNVRGDWTASYLIAAVNPLDLMVGDANDFALAVNDDPALFSKIARITIGGTVRAEPGTNHIFGFAAQEIGAFTLGGVKVLLIAGRSNDTFDASHAHFLGPSTSNLNADGFAVHVFEV